MDISSLIFIDATGYHYADYPTFLTWVQDQYRGIYGNDIYLGPDSQDGQWLAILAQSFFDLAALGSVNMNSFSPVSAQGVGLSRLVKLNGIMRESPSFSTVQLLITGTSGTVLNNCFATDSLQQQWNIPNGTTIPGGGTITVTATANVAGAINAQANTITTIGTPTRGWQAVNNAAAATPGAPVETDALLRSRQAISVSLPAQTVFDATLAAVGNVPGVQRVRGYENATGTTGGGSSGSASQPAHSISVIVVGGNQNNIAGAIQVKKTPGTQTWGDPMAAGYTSVATVDSRGMPVTIDFEYATVATIAAQVTVVPGTGWSSATSALIQNAVAAAIAAYGIGSVIILNQLFNAAYLYGTPQFGTFTISSIQINKNGGGFAASNITLAYDENPSCPPAGVVVTI